MLLFFVHVMSGSQILQVGPRMTQIGECVQVCRMPSRFVGETQRGAENNNKREYGAMSCSLHSLLKCHFAV
jgi:hypothetical protein